VIRDLVYDVGMNNASDTAYYLHRGFRVVAIEANPELVDAARQRFSKEIAQGRLTVLNVAIAEQDGIRPFWICDDLSDWSSFDREIASRDGAAHHAIEVACRTFGSVLDEFGVPFFLKVDIEGRDHLCLEALKADRCPRYLSAERGERTLALLPRLAELGYSGFKCISQRYFIPLQLNPSEKELRYSRLLRLHNSGSIPARIFRRLGGKLLVHLLTERLRSEGDWTFPPGSSGPFGESTPGRWHTLEEIQETMSQMQIRRAAGERSPFWDHRAYSFWADFHARQDL
jgi:FkbM family methyltransferase